MNLTHQSSGSDDLRLAQGVEANLHALFGSMARALDGEIEDTGSLTRHICFPSNPMFKGVSRIRLADGDADKAITETTEWLKRRKAPFAFWWVGPGTRPDDLGERLKSHGMFSMERQEQELARGIKAGQGGAPCMAADLRRVNERALRDVPAGFEVMQVRDSTGLESFKKIFVEVYGIPEWAGQAWVDATLHAGIGNTPWKMYLGLLGGRPVATNMLYCGGGVASVYAVATAADVRGRGIGGAVTLAPLIEARAAGFDEAVLFATAMGVGAYERIGFRKTGYTIDRYLWRAQE